MKFRTLLLSTAGAIAMAGGAQAADLAVAAPGGICPDGWIAVPGGWCLQVGIRIREDLSYAKGDEIEFNTNSHFVLRGNMPTEMGDAGVVAVFEGTNNGGGVVVKDGTKLYVGGFSAGIFNPPGSGGGYTDNDGYHPDTLNPNALQYMFGNVANGAITVYVSDGDTYAAGDDSYIVAAGWTGMLGVATLSVNGGALVGGGQTGWGASASVVVPMGQAKFKVGAAYAHDAEGFASNNGIDRLGTIWTALASVQVPLGAINTAALTVSYENAPAGTDFAVVGALVQNWNPVISTREEARWDQTTGDVTALVRFEGHVGSP